MDSNIRLIAKSLSWQLMGVILMTLIGYVFTGSVAAGGGIAVAGALTGLCTYFVHEKLWGLVGWGRR